MAPDDRETSHRLGEACGVFGAFLPDRPAVPPVMTALAALQHRGQESAGVAIVDGRTIRVATGMGLVRDVFSAVTLATYLGGRAIGHTRYSTSGQSVLANAQPFVVDADIGPIALAHNGTLSDVSRLAPRVREMGLCARIRFGQRYVDRGNRRGTRHNLVGAHLLGTGACAGLL